MSILSYCFICKRNDDFIHPLGLGCFCWFLFAALGSYEPLYVTGLQSSWLFKTHLCIFFSGVFLSLVPIIFNVKNRSKLNLKLNITNKYKYVSNLLYFFCIIAFLIRFQSVLLSPPFFSSGGGDLKQLIPKAIVGLQYVDLLTPFLAILTMFELFFLDNISKKRKLFLICFFIFTIVNIVFYKCSRGDLIVILLPFLYFYNLKFKLKIHIALMFFSIIIIIFIYIASVRISALSLVNNYWGDTSNNYMSIFSSIYTYTALNFENFNKLVITHHDYTGFQAVLGSLLKPFLSLVNISNINIVSNETLFFNAKTYMYNFYYDLGLFGVVFYSLLISLFVNYIYSLSRSDLRYCLIVAFMYKACVFLFFGNYFFDEMVVMFPYLISFIIVFSLYKKIRL
ncbi:O-antigen polymerase [Photobacterium damselae]|uniref:O-antigen polymerase n=1 Tax=Photobacterium damselae TaxID=38293 RepID=UPI001C625096